MPDETSNFEPKLWMITSEQIVTATEGEKGVRDFFGGVLGSDDRTPEAAEEVSVKTKVAVALPVGKLQQNLSQFMGVVENLFTQAEKQAKKTQQISEASQKLRMQLDQIELSVGMNAEGQVGFWGLAETKVGGITQIKLTFNRKET